VSDSTLENRLVDVLGRYVSHINAELIAERGRRVLERPDRVTEGERGRLLAALRMSAAQFVTSSFVMSKLEAELETVVGGGVEVSVREIAIDGEDDLRGARIAARDLALALRASSLSAQRVATVVSELARNIVAYTPGGSIRFESKGRRLRIVAADRGRGIPNLDAVLGGTYRSKTGLGRGLLGVRRLMDSFDVETGPEGTRITVEAAL
jgi:serine/threonine-protein kinase RsbT